MQLNQLRYTTVFGASEQTLGQAVHTDEGATQVHPLEPSIRNQSRLASDGLHVHPRVYLVEAEQCKVGFQVIAPSGDLQARGGRRGGEWIRGPECAP